MTPQNLFCCCYSIDNQVNKLVAREKTLHLKGKSPNDRYWMPLALMIAASVFELGEWGTKIRRVCARVRGIGNEKWGVSMWEQGTGDRKGLTQLKSHRDS